jgi:DNA-directed RNA polymerase specialized sigma24 family protein
MELNQDGFERLLALLDAHKDTLNKLRERLNFYFAHQGVPDSDADMLADESISRVTQKLAGDGGDENPAEKIRSPRGFCVAFARNVLHEYWRDRKRETIDLDQLTPSQMPSYNPIKLEQEGEESLLKQKRVACMRQCLRGLPAKDRELITQNCTVEDRGKLAEQLSLTLTALRIRVCRIRKKLKECLTRCLNQLK